MEPSPTMVRQAYSEVEHLARAEQRAIERHQDYLQEIRGEAVSMADTLSDWRANYAHKWRQACLARMLEHQRAEMERHKWIESEKAECDVGKQAVLDWIQQYAGRWRKWYDENEDFGVIDDLYR
jgi:hypothetical protein